MATATPTRCWTLAELLDRFGPMPADRIRTDPAPGTATEEDVVRIHEREDLLYELVDGVLVRKTMGYYESYLMIAVSALLYNFVTPRNLGLVAGADGMIRLNPDLVRIPDVSFISADRLPDRRVPREPICPIVPDLAIEILSKGNTAKEMDEKLVDYFAAGVRLVWYIDPETRTARAFTSVDDVQLIREGQALDGGAVLPGFVLPLRDLFAEPLADPNAAGPQG